MKSTIILTTSGFGFLCSYFLDLTLPHAEQFISIIAVLFLDGFFGIIGGIKREGFKTYKALKILKSVFAWVVILAVILTIETGFPRISWLSETIIPPFIIFQLMSALKNASMAGFIKNELLNTILDTLDKHKGKRTN
tara:strand:- start:3664 stop:4074 length:411 start_codon:yes stop_codon:yes gene_type:complete